MYQLSNTSKSKLETCHIDLQRVVLRAIQISSVDFGVSCGHRTLKEQQYLFSIGASKCDGIKYKSDHQNNPSNAVDLYAYVNGSANWEHKYYQDISEAMFCAADELDIKIGWGGDWKTFKDSPHFYLDT